jgi:hypothetical protein
MPTVEEVLRESGFTDEQIAGMDRRAVTAFSTVLSTADREKAEAAAAREAAELAQRSNIDFYDNRIAPSLVQWEEEKQRLENEKARMAAEVSFYRTQNEAARGAGFVPSEAPGFDPAKFVPPNPATPTRDAQGRYLAGVPGSTPGSPQFFDVNKIYERAGAAMNTIGDIQHTHQLLFGRPMPILPSVLIAQADAMKLDPMAYAARTFNFDARREQLRQEEEKAQREKIAQEAIAPYEQKLKEAEDLRKKEVEETNRKWAERAGNNPDVRPAADPKLADIQRGVKNNELPDPLTLNDQQRRAMTSQMIRKDIESNAA